MRALRLLGAPALLPVLVLLAGPVPHASAATVSLTQGQLRVAALPGEENDLTLTAVDPVVTVRDAGPAPVAGPGCTAVAPDAVRCASVATVLVATGDADDAVRFSGSVPAVVDGGAGSDVLSAGPGGTILTGGDGDDDLIGGDGIDVLGGGAGADTLTGGAGDDVLQGGTGDDRLDGGTGRDAASWAERRTPVRVDLADPAVDGGAGEADALAGIEDLTGGTGADVLLGKDGANRITGGGGADRVEGRAGDDTLSGLHVRGGNGQDRITLVGAGSRPSFAGVSCGSGLEDILDVPSTALLRIPADCERRAIGARTTVELRQLHVRKGRLLVRLPNCTGRPDVRVLQGGRTLRRIRSCTGAMVPVASAAGLTLDARTTDGGRTRRSRIALPR